MTAKRAEVYGEIIGITSDGGYTATKIPAVSDRILPVSFKTDEITRAGLPVEVGAAFLVEVSLDVFEEGMLHPTNLRPFNQDRIDGGR